MRALQGFSILVGLVASMSCMAQDVQSCDASLAPSIEKSASDYSLAQSYIYVNAAHEYERLKNSTSESRGASASYKFFGAEYNDSKSAEQFQQKVRDRLEKEGFGMQESEARSSYRRFLSDKQLEAWANCVQTVSKGSAVFLGADAVSDAGFPLRIKWFPPQGVAIGTLVIRVQNATINGQNQLQAKLEGVSERAFIVEPDTTKNQIVITAEIAGAANAITLPRSFPVAKLATAKTPEPPKPPRVTIVVRASEFIRPTNVALGGPPKANYGSDVLLNAPPYVTRPNAAEFEFSAVRGGAYQLKVEYAAAWARPVTIVLNKSTAIENALNAPTGCWEQTCQRLLNQGRVNLKDGLNTMRVERGDVFPHIRKFVFEPSD